MGKARLEINSSPNSSLLFDDTSLGLGVGEQRDKVVFSDVYGNMKNHKIPSTQWANKDSNQTVRMCRLIWVFVTR